MLNKEALLKKSTNILICKSQ